MKTIFVSLILVVCLGSCNRNSDSLSANIITSDIDNFWKAYDMITTTSDSTLQYTYLDSLYFRPGTPGLKGIIQARNYTPDDYINAIKNYPKFWESIRDNTLRADEFVGELNVGIEKIRAIYPELKPAKIYFTVGALRTGGTYLDSLVLIGSEIAMGDKNTVTTELPEETISGRRAYFDSNPINDLVLLNVHEYVHTQQKELVHNLLSYCLHEGVAEFVSTKAMGMPSAVPAIEFGKQNPEVKKKFEQEMFFGNNVSQWLWSDASNEFGVRDLGYYIGYEMAELHYKKSTDKQLAIKTMIELDYTNETQIEEFVNQTELFSKSLEALYQDFEAKRPRVSNIEPFSNQDQNVKPGTRKISIYFSEPLNGYNTGIDFGPLGKDHFPIMSPDRIWSDDNRVWTVEVQLEPNQHYQFLVSNNFRLNDGTPLKPYLVEFKTAPN